MSDRTDESVAGPQSQPTEPLPAPPAAAPEPPLPPAPPVYAPAPHTPMHLSRHGAIVVGIAGVLIFGALSFGTGWHARGLAFRFAGPGHSIGMMQGGQFQGAPCQPGAQGYGADQGFRRPGGMPGRDGRGFGAQDDYGFRGPGGPRSGDTTSDAGWNR